MLCLAAAGGMSAQTILEENFETGNTGDKPLPVVAGEGWTVVNSYTGATTKYNWHNYYANPDDKGGATLSGACCAACDGPFMVTNDDTDGIGPREEILLSPELNLNDNYQLQFQFKVGPTNSVASSKYDLEVRVVIGDNLKNAETVFSIQNEKMLRESGVLDFPITTWTPYTAQVDLSDYKGEKVKLAFVYKMYTEVSNIAYLDEISVKKFTPATTPVAALSTTRYQFTPDLYIGEKRYSEVITLTNKGTDGLTVNSVDLPAGFSINGDLTNLNLARYKTASFQIVCTSSLTSAASGNVVLHTNGGDVTVAVTANKLAVPEGYSLETFETFNTPAGWKNTGWTWTTSAFEGDHSMSASGDVSNTILRSPRLDLTQGGSVMFSYYNSYFSDDDDAPTYDIEMQLSTDGGDNWTTKWTSSSSDLNALKSATIDLGTFPSDDCYVRWYYPAVEIDDYGAVPHSIFTLDRVLLPHVFGSDDVPLTATIVSPANGAKDIYPRDIKLEWAPAQFAKGYKVYVGTNSDANDLVNGQDVGSALTYTVASCKYETTYYWKVVPYNDKGDASRVSKWSFTTQPDVTVSQFPYEQDFTTPGTPEGWTQTPSATYGRTWDLNSRYPYEVGGKKYGVFSTTWLAAGDWNACTTQEFQLPADKMMSITFAWGDGHPSDLVSDETGLAKKNNVEPNNGVSELRFQVLADGEWTTLATLSENPFKDDKKYWIPEKIDLDAYKGKKVQFRWCHYSYSGNDDGGAIARIRLYENEDSKGAFNKESWNAGKVNYNKAVESGNQLTIINEGKSTLKVSSVEFTNPNFSATLKAGDEIPANDTKAFSIRFDALQQAGELTDNMTVKFEGGYSMTFPVSGEALPEGTYYYSFEPNELDYKWTDDFTMIDVDGGVNYNFSSYWVHYSAGGAKGAFSVESDSYEDGMYGMMKPVSGMYALVGASPTSTGADNWIIWKKMRATANSSFEFYARNWQTASSVMPDPRHNVTVLVSTAGNTDTSDFTTVMRRTEMPLLEGDNWNHYTVPLSEYAGQDIYVAVQHSTISASNLAFFDDFCFHNFAAAGSGITGVKADIADDARVEVYTTSGILAAEGEGKAALEGLAHGFYIVKVTAADGTVNAFSIAR